MGTVYHVIDRYTRQNVALKAVNTSSDKLIFGTRTPHNTTLKDSDLRIALAREFRALASLRHPNVITVLDYGFADNKPYFTMELLEENQDLISAGEDLSKEEKLNLIRQILQALIYLHQRGIIHRDLKPANIQVVDGQVKILDFGLAIAANKTQSENLSGTLAYMAPEVMRGEAATEKSDLFAVGMIIFELLTGNYPFPITNIGTLIQQIVYDEIPLENHFEDTRIIKFLENLLAKDPQQRFVSAREAMNYCISCNLIQTEPESEMIRESFLQAAQFVGRKEEIKQLSSALQLLHTERTGSSWLVGGESGVGKTRLLDELRIQALVDGVMVLRGQAVEAGGRPYSLMHNPLRQLCLSTQLEDDEAVVLLPIIPDMAEYLMQQDKSEIVVPSRIQTAVRNKLIQVVEAMFRRQRQGILIILEDLQWLKESLPIVQMLIGLSKEMPLMVVGSYRDDERPELAQALDVSETIKLGRLTREQIAELSTSIIGEQIGREPAIVNMLERETEGNVFFIVEVMRILAERAGQFDQIMFQTLPIDVFSGGIHALIQRRLARLPDTMLDLLKIAALAGRDIDLELLAHHNQHNLDLERWLMQCSNAVVLEFNDEIWHFSHDKIRKALIQAMPNEDKQRIHLALADTLEKLGDSSNNPRYALIAFHQEEAGQRTQAILSYEVAAETALRQLAFDNAQQYLEHIQRLERQLNDYERSQVASPTERAHRHRIWGEVCDASGDMDGSREQYEAVLSNLMPTEQDANMTISNIAVRSKAVPLSQSEQDILYSSDRLLTIYLYQGDWEQALVVTSRQGALYFGLGYQDLWVETVAIEAWIYYYQGQFKEAERLFKRIFTLGKEKKLASLLIFGGTGMIMNAIRLHLGKEELGERLSDLQDKLLHVKDEGSPVDSILLHGVLALAYWHLDEKVSAHQYAKTALNQMNKTENIHLVEFAGFVGATEMLLNLDESTEEKDEQVQAEIIQACKSLHIFAQVYPLARPRAWIYQGRENWLKDKQKRAIHALQVAITQAQQCNISYDEGIAYLTLARLVKPEHPDYLSYLDLAIARFESVAATEQLNLARAMKDTKTDASDGDDKADS